MAYESCSTLLQLAQLPPLLICVQCCGYVPQSQFLELVTAVASSLDGSSDVVLQLSPANIDVQELWASAAAISPREMRTLVVFDILDSVDLF